MEPELVEYKQTIAAQAPILIDVWSGWSAYSLLAFSLAAEVVLRVLAVAGILNAPVPFSPLVDARTGLAQLVDATIEPL